ncbi:MAG: cytidine deaminase [Halarchaeum sp.]
MNDADRALVAAARDAMANAYVPYSDYPVGAAVETASGDVYTGCNVENANYSNTLHAEEVALAGAARAGDYELARVAVTNEERDGLTPCGMCRQTLAEFGGDDLRIVCDAGESAEIHVLGDLLPDTITRERLD